MQQDQGVPAWATQGNNNNNNVDDDTTNGKTGAVLGASVLGAVAGTLVLGPVGAVAVAGGVAYAAATQQGPVGNVVRGAGRWVARAGSSVVGKKQQQQKNSKE